MHLADRGAYQHDNDHPQHAAFVHDRWLPEVAELMENNTEAL